MMISVPG